MNKLILSVYFIITVFIQSFAQTSVKGASILFVAPTLPNNCKLEELSWLINAEKKSAGRYWFAFNNNNEFIYNTVVMKDVQDNWKKSGVDQSVRNKLRAWGVKYIIYQNVKETNGVYTVDFTIVDTTNFKKPVAIGNYCGQEQRFDFWFHNSIKKYVIDCNAGSTRKNPVFINPFDPTAGDIEYMLEDSLLMCPYKNSRITDNYYLVHENKQPGPNMRVVAGRVQSGNCMVYLNGGDIGTPIKMGIGTGNSIKKAAIEISKRLP